MKNEDIEEMLEDTIKWSKIWVGIIFVLLGKVRRSGRINDNHDLIIEIMVAIPMI